VNDSKPPRASLEAAAANGLLHRRLFLTGGVLLAGAGLQLLTARPAAAAAAAGAPGTAPDYMRAPGAGLRAYGERSPHEATVLRSVGAMPGTTGSGASRTPLERLEGIVTPSSLHFERHHNGVPDIDPDQHQLLIHGLVRRPLVFSMAALLRYPAVSRVLFIECAGNSGGNLAPEPPALSCGGLHGLASCSEWTGVPLSILLDEAGVAPESRWLLAEGGDAAAMGRSVPMAKAMDDALIALFQNGERLRPENGYPVRLLLPGYEGNMSVKWLRRIKVTPTPTMTKDETSKYSDLQSDGRSLQFTFPMHVKSVITSPAGGLAMQGPGLYQVSGLAWSAAGRIRRVDVSADGGRTWAEAALADPVLPQAFTRFRIPWQWNGDVAVLQSRAIDEAGTVQPTRAKFLAEPAARSRYHNNSIQSWSVTAAGEVLNVYA
jgi:sulfane dehydrogenase subunit SoxC